MPGCNPTFRQAKNRDVMKINVMVFFITSISCREISARPSKHCAPKRLVPTMSRYSDGLLGVGFRPVAFRPEADVRLRSPVALQEWRSRSDRDAGWNVLFGGHHGIYAIRSAGRGPSKVRTHFTASESSTRRLRTAASYRARFAKLSALAMASSAVDS